MYNHDQIAAAERRPKEARIVCHQKNPNKCRAIAWWSVNNDAENIIAAISFPKIITDFVVTNHLNTYSSKRLFKKIQYNIPSIYKLILESPLDCRVPIIWSISNVLSKINHVISIIIDITIPVKRAIWIPSLEGIFFDIVFLSTRKYQRVGTKKIHNLHEKKNIWEVSSSSIILIPKITEIEGIKPTRSIAIIDCFFDSITYATSIR